MDERLPTTIDRDAPAISRRSLVVPAPRRAVWAVHVDVPKWPEWQPEIGTASIDGPFAAGSTIAWTTIGVDETIPSTLTVVEMGERTVWRGPAMGVVGIHEWRFTDVPEGTRVDTEESWTGRSVDEDPAKIVAFLDGSLDAWLRHLRERVLSLRVGAED